MTLSFALDVQRPEMPEGFVSTVAVTWRLGAADWDGDGDRDLFAVSDATGEVLWLEQESPRTYRPPVVVDLDPVAETLSALEAAHGDTFTVGSIAVLDVQTVVLGPGGREGLALQIQASRGEDFGAETYTPTVILEPGPRLRFLDLGQTGGSQILPDLDGDGAQEVVLATPTGIEVAWSADPARVEAVDLGRRTALREARQGAAACVGDREVLVLQAQEGSANWDGWLLSFVPGSVSVLDRAEYARPLWWVTGSQERNCTDGLVAIPELDPMERFTDLMGTALASTEGEPLVGARSWWVQLDGRAGRDLIHESTPTPTAYLDDGAGGLDLRQPELPEEDGNPMVIPSERLGGLFTDIDGDGLADHVRQNATEDQIVFFFGWNTTQ